MTNSTRALSIEPWERLGDEASRLVARQVPGDPDIDDVVQEVLVRVWRHGDRLRDDERFGAWLARIARNAANDHLRTRQRQRLRSLPLPADPEAVENSASVPQDEDVKSCITAVLQPFVRALPPTYREVIELSELDELPHAAIAQRLGLSVSGVKSRVQRGRERLRNMLELCCEIAVDSRGTPVTCDPRPDGVVPPGCCEGATREVATPQSIVERARLA